MEVAREMPTSYPAPRKKLVPQPYPTLNMLYGQGIWQHTVIGIIDIH